MALTFRVLSVNLAKAAKIASKFGLSGIFKLPQNGAVEVSSEGLLGDAIINRKHHGGPDQAVYVYTSEDYAWWQDALDMPVPPGTFGENLTICGLKSAELIIGDRLECDQLVLEVKSSRIPCRTLALRMQDPGFIDKFKRAELPGFYCKVLKPGQVSAGQKGLLLPYEGEKVSILQDFRNFYRLNTLTEMEKKRLLNAPINAKLRAFLEGKADSA
ncbi:MAG: MOSC domain-containing protein [Anaerolineaceae bacterium]|nr:MOSC domain-containing protein [Anaerolineaceae bacterium]